MCGCGTRIGDPVYGGRCFLRGCVVCSTVFGRMHAVLTVIGACVKANPCWGPWCCLLFCIPTFFPVDWNPGRCTTDTETCQYQVSIPHTCSFSTSQQLLHVIILVWFYIISHREAFSPTCFIKKKRREGTHLTHSLSTLSPQLLAIWFLRAAATNIQLHAKP